jgi:hypothetical protein
MICQYRTFLLNWSLSRKNPYASVPKLTAAPPPVLQIPRRWHWMSNHSTA